MNEVLREFLHCFTIFYNYDILIYSQNLADHYHCVTQVLQIPSVPPWLCHGPTRHPNGPEEGTGR